MNEEQSAASPWASSPGKHFTFRYRERFTCCAVLICLLVGNLSVHPANSLMLRCITFAMFTSASINKGQAQDTCKPGLQSTPSKCETSLQNNTRSAQRSPAQPAQPNFAICSTYRAVCLHA